MQFELELPPIPKERLRQLARSAPATASVYGSAAGHSIPKPPLPGRLLRGPNFVVASTGSSALLAALVAFLTYLAAGATHGIDWFSILGSSLGGALVLAAGTVGYVIIRRTRRIEDLRREVGSLVDNVMSDVLTQPDAFAASEIVQAEVMSQLAPLTARYEQRRYWRYAEPLVSAEQAGDSGVFAVAADARVVMPARMAVFRRLRVRV